MRAYRHVALVIDTIGLALVARVGLTCVSQRLHTQRE